LQKKKKVGADLKAQANHDGPLHNSFPVGAAKACPVSFCFFGECKKILFVRNQAGIAGTCQPPLDSL
jgi:hypothetical protein